MKSSNIGGQAVLEGIMMRNGGKYAVAVRKPDGEIEVKEDEYTSVIKWKKLTRIPFVRGVFNFVDSLVLGLKTLNYSASFYMEETDVVITIEEAEKQKKKEDILMAVTMVFSVVIALGLFMVLPGFVADLLKNVMPSRILRTVLESILRISIFVIYIVLVSKMEEIKRTFMYHGAEHKCINCIEHGLELNVENVKASSRLHKRCGPSFLLIVMVVSVLVTMFVRIETVWLRVLSRIILLPVIAGVSYEVLKLAGRSESPIITAISKPGLMMQKLTTREPDEQMIEVAIQSVEAVFDWRAFVSEESDSIACKSAADGVVGDSVGNDRTCADEAKDSEV